MKSTEQSQGQSIFDHCWLVYEYFQDLYNHLEYDIPLEYTWKLPDWIYKYKEQLFENLLPIDIIEEYLKFHDCGKINTREIDVNGKIHFHNHSEESYKIWLEVGGTKESAELMKDDMLIHTIKDIDVNNFCKKESCITLLLSGLSEIHSNAEMFGGINSIGFKVKFKQIDRRGNAICKKLFK